MIMENKIYLLLVVFLVIIARSISDDADQQKTQTPTNRLYYNGDAEEDNHDRKNNDHPKLPNRRNRYSPHESSSSNSLRGRSRKPSSFENSLHSNDRSRHGYGHNSLANLPDSGVFYNKGPGCHSLVDAQYPIFSDFCGALPQARYSLPNSFGHIERWQIAQVISGTINPSTNPVCVRSLRLLLCPLLFPPCPKRHEAQTMIPCQSFCRTVKSQCAAPSLDRLPCDFLPPKTELCPMNPTPFSSFLSSYGQPLPLPGGPSPMLPPPGLSSSSLSSLLALAGIPSSSLNQHFQQTPRWPMV